MLDTPLILVHHQHCIDGLSFVERTEVHSTTLQSKLTGS